MVKPTRDKILVEPITIADQRAVDVAARIPGFEIPDPEMQGAPKRGRVYAIGEDVSIDIAVGDVVIFTDMVPKGFEIDGLKLFVLLPYQIEAKL